MLSKCYWLIAVVEEWSGVELNLRPTDSRPVCLGVGPPFAAHDQILHVL
jgi:hypothetical protein